jgi:5'-3' exonuclease
MGIKDFSKVFQYQNEIKYKDLKNKTVAVDAMYQLHRTAHPFKTISTAVLTAPDGTSTNHINGLLALIFNLKKANAKQIWIFDNPGENHNSLKIIENERRRSCKQVAQKKLELLDEPKLFSDDDSEITPTDTISLKLIANKYQRASFSLETYMIIDLKYILDCFNISWIEAPIGYEAEQLAAYITINELNGVKADAVLTPDPDCLLFGAKCMIKNDKQKLYKYELSTLLKDANINQNDLVKIGIILGCDFAEKTSGIGPKSVIKKFNNVELTDKQKSAYEYFKKPICPNSLKQLKWNSFDNIPFTNQEKINELFEWIIQIKGFNRSRTETRFKNAKIMI